MLSRRTVLLGFAGAAASPAIGKDLSSTLYSRSVVIDGLGGPGGSDRNAGPDSPLTPQALLDVRASGVTAVNVTVSQVGDSPSAYEDTLSVIGFNDQKVAANPDVLVKVLTAVDIDLAKHTRRLGLIYGFQDTHLLGKTLDRLPVFYDRGVRIVQLTYNARNFVGDGCLAPSDEGLSAFGREVVGELNMRRLLVDLSHAGRRTTAEAIAASRAPVAITHTGCRALANHPRNTDDSALRALAERGGVAGVYFMPFLRTAGQPMAEDVVRHIEHMLKVCGEESVGVGTDGAISPVVVDEAYREAHRKFIAERRRRGISGPGEDENVFDFVPDYNEPRRLERLAVDLGRRGVRARVVEKVIGGNFLRLFRDVWA